MMRGTPAATASKDSNKGAKWLIAIIGGVILLSGISQCSSGTSTRTAEEVAATDPTIRTLNSAVAAQTLPAVQDLDPRGVETGRVDMRKSFVAEGLSGAMVYSQNCYDALSRAFDWRRLDTCGAADLMAVASVPADQISGLDKEITYFQSEVAAARYLGAATGAGANASEADERLSNMQAKLPVQQSTRQDQKENDDATSPAPALEDPFNSNATADDGDEAAWRLEPSMPDGLSSVHWRNA